MGGSQRGNVLRMDALAVGEGPTLKTTSVNSLQ